MSKIKHPDIRISDPIIMGEEGLKALLEEIKTIEKGRIDEIEYNLYETTMGRGVRVGGSSGPLVSFVQIGENHILGWVYRMNADEASRISLYGPTKFDKVCDELGKRVYSMAKKYGPKLTKQWVLEPKFL